MIIFFDVEDAFKKIRLKNKDGAARIVGQTATQCLIEGHRNEYNELMKLQHVIFYRQLWKSLTKLEKSK